MTKKRKFTWLVLGGMLFALLASFWSCVPEQAEPEELSLTPHDEALSMEEMVSDDGKTQPGDTSVADGAKGGAKPKSIKGTIGMEAEGSPSVKQKDRCLNLMNRFVTPYRALHQMLPPGAYTGNESALDRLIKITPAQCHDAEGRKRAVAAIVDSVNEHGGKIGIMLPLTGSRSKFTSYLLTGMRAAFREAGADFDKLTVIKDTNGPGKVVEQRLAELIFRDKVASIVGGLEGGDAALLVKWSNELMVPVMLLTRDRETIEPSAFAFRIYPDEWLLAVTLAEAAVKRGLKKVAVLKPTTGKSDKIVHYFKEALTASGGQVTQELLYVPSNFESMQAVGRQLFKIDNNARRDEYAAAYRKAKEAAAKQGTPFDTRMVVLKPVVDVDAVFLPDDFRTVRHFAKLFKFHGVTKLPMIGNHEWRSPALIEPFDEFLEGAVFADFIGDYHKLPSVIRAPTTSSPYFIDAKLVIDIDFQLIGYRAAKTVIAALANTTVKRRHLGLSLLKARGEAGSFFGDKPLFDEHRNVTWPTFIFTVQDGNLKLDDAAHPGSLGAKSPKAAKTAAKGSGVFSP